MKNKNDILDGAFSSEEKSLLEVINASYLSIEDVKWLKSKWWFRRFIKVYAKELKKRYDDKPVIKKEFKEEELDPIVEIDDEIIDVLDFTQSIKMPSKEVIEILDFTKTIDITDVKDIADATETAQKKVKLEKKIWTAISIICTFVIIILSIILINWLLENKKTTNMVDNIYEVSELVEVEEETTAPIVAGEEETTIKETTTTKLSDYYKYANMNMIEANFDNLKSINPDTVGWIKVSGTKINYPYVQASDNDYYLKHSYDKSSNKKGWVFLDYRNDMESLSKNTILYAHGLTNNTMFGSMRTVLKPAWYNNKSNYVIKISTPTSNQLWHVFSVYTIEPESYYITSRFVDDTEYEKFLSTIKSRSIHDFGIDINKNDYVLTLSSCYDKTKRMVIHAKLIEKQSR